MNARLEEFLKAHPRVGNAMLLAAVPKEPPEAPSPLLLGRFTCVWFSSIDRFHAFQAATRDSRKSEWAAIPVDGWRPQLETLDHLREKGARAVYVDLEGEFATPADGFPLDEYRAALAEQVAEERLAN